ncbi:uncharacterized protein LOC111638025 [Centruroides sculpturatus]|uniref:uncharacterized protein LOC111638025 n=1 Tax=Centruroides sculpturatus TaxID=218467 RepID=UPI000C6E4784|nr:uncharacterized protein LOC111638025 [Centruroides sculpturatus]
MMKFVLAFFILSLIPKQPGNCMINIPINVNVLTSGINLPQTLSTVLEEFGPNARVGLLNCLNSTIFPTLECKNETNSGSDWPSILKLIPCVLKKICFANDSASATRVIRCITGVVGYTGENVIGVVGNLTDDVLEKYLDNIYGCVFGIYTNIRNGVTNCNFFDGIQELNVTAIEENLKNNLLSDTTSNLEKFFKILFGNMDEKCTLSG